jgi:hypothetical protein
LGIERDHDPLDISREKSPPPPALALKSGTPSGIEDEHLESAKYHGSAARQMHPKNIPSVRHHPKLQFQCGPHGGLKPRMALQDTPSRAQHPFFNLEISLVGEVLVDYSQHHAAGRRWLNATLHEHPAPPRHAKALVDAGHVAISR